MADKEKTKFSGEHADWTYFKTQLLAEALEKKPETVGKWLKAIDKNIHDSSKWQITTTGATVKQIDEEANEAIYNFIVRRLDRNNAIIIGGEYEDKGAEAWKYLLTEYEKRDRKDAGVDAMVELMNLKYSDYGATEVDTFLSKLTLNINIHNRTNYNNTYSDAQQLAFLLHALPNTEEWSQTRIALNDLSGPTLFSDAKQIVHRKSKILAAISAANNPVTLHVDHNNTVLSNFSG